jgi:hypothetical protein
MIHRLAAIVLRGGQNGGCFGAGPTQVLVQVETGKPGYNFPTVVLDPLATTGDGEERLALQREFAQAYDLTLTALGLAAVHTDGAVETDFYWGELPDARDLPDVIPHEQVNHLKLVWRNLAELQAEPLLPLGIYERLRQPEGPPLYF